MGKKFIDTIGYFSVIGTIIGGLASPFNFHVFLIIFFIGIIFAITLEFQDRQAYITEAGPHMRAQKMVQDANDILRQSESERAQQDAKIFFRNYKKADDLRERARQLLIAASKLENIQAQAMLNQLQADDQNNSKTNPHSTVIRTREVGEQEPNIVDLNLASAEEMADLDGMSLVLAKRIIKLREQNGGFISFDDVVQAIGMKPHVAERLRPLVMVSAKKSQPQSNNDHVGTPSGSRVVDY